MRAKVIRVFKHLLVLFPVLSLLVACTVQGSSVERQTESQSGCTEVKTGAESTQKESAESRSVKSKRKREKSKKSKKSKKSDKRQSEGTVSIASETLSEVEISEALAGTAAEEMRAVKKSVSETRAPEHGTEVGNGISKDGNYTFRDEVALYLHIYGKLPKNFISKKEAEEQGFRFGEGNFDEAFSGMSVGGSRFGNYDGKFSDKNERRYYECDIDYTSGRRNAKRLVYSNDGLTFYTEDHYKTFTQLYQSIRQRRTVRETRWKIYSKQTDFGAILTRFSVSPTLARILINRGVVEEEISEYLPGALGDVLRGALLPDMTESVRILAGKIRSRAPVRIIGDYDIDGVCSAHVLVQGLRAPGAATDCDTPDHTADGYRLNLRLVERVVADDIDTVVTRDNDIAARQEIAAAADAGLTVVVTDHHEVAHGEDGAEPLPSADTVVDPRREGSQHPFVSIRGAVVAWKLIEGLFLFFGKRWEEARVFLPFAAITMVGDVMPLEKENCIIVREDLKTIGSCDNLGLWKLVARCGLGLEALSAYHIGFVIGPCSNAGGRLESVKFGFLMLLETGEESAEAVAECLKALNDRWKQTTEEGIRAASVETDVLSELPKALVVYLGDCHESVAGIIAGRLKEKYYRPSLVLADSQEVGLLKGSGRSIEGYHMFRALEEVALLLTKSGGHPMAARFIPPETELVNLREELNRNAMLSDEQLTETQWIDTAPPFVYMNEEPVAELSRMEPFGQGNACPCFGQKNVRIRAAQVLGKNRNVVKLSLQDEVGIVRKAPAFTDGDAFLAEMKGSRPIAVLYYPEINEYMGRRNLQLVPEAWKFVR